MKANTHTAIIFKKGSLTMSSHEILSNQGSVSETDIQKSHNSLFKRVITASALMLAGCGNQAASPNNSNSASAPKNTPAPAKTVTPKNVPYKFANAPNLNYKYPCNILFDNPQTKAFIYRNQLLASMAFKNDLTPYVNNSITAPTCPLANTTNPHSPSIDVYGVIISPLVTTEVRSVATPLTLPGNISAVQETIAKKVTTTNSTPNVKYYKIIVEPQQNNASTDFMVFAGCETAQEQCKTNFSHIVNNVRKLVEYSYNSIENNGGIPNTPPNQNILAT